MSKSRKRRNTFPEMSSRSAAAEWNYDEQIDADTPSPGLFGFFRDIGVRETIESLLVAVLLALMFRALECENCRKRYHTGTSVPNSKSDVRDDSTHCPICRFPTRLSRDRTKKPDHVSNNGDRILVNKFTYDFSDPERFDVIVFKNPHNGKQNYIKRLIGLPGDNLTIENGDIYLFDQTDDGWGTSVNFWRTLIGHHGGKILPAAATGSFWIQTGIRSSKPLVVNPIGCDIGTSSLSKLSGPQLMPCIPRS